MTGTSLDGIDAALVSFETLEIKVHRFLETPYPDALRAEFLALFTRGDDELHRLQLAAHHRSTLVAQSVKTLCSDISPKDVIAIADHGQTIRHFPNKTPPYTLQAHHGAHLSELTGLPCVVDFRSKDIAAGGQGAPLAPAFHQAYFADPKRYRLVINIGGLANISLLKPGAQEAALGFDTGPGNTLLDAWCQHHTGANYDKNGQWGATGETSHALLDHFLDDEYFKQLPPKSTGREYFNMAWLTDKLSTHQFNDLGNNHIQASLTTLTAHSIALGIEQACSMHDIKPATDIEGIYICGGGAYNTALMSALKTALPGDVHSTEKLGVPPEQVEAVAFAWLAKQAIENQITELVQTTGAHHASVLGAIYPA